MKSIKLYAFLYISILMSACEKKVEETAVFDRKGILTNITYNLIQPAYRDFQRKAEALEKAAIVYQGNQDSAMLDTVKTRWLEAKRSWKIAEAFNFGPIDSLLLENKIDLWPTSENGIQTAIENYNGEPDYLNGIGSNRKGLPALEYLLFEPLKGTNDMLQKRLLYITLLSKALNQHAKTLVNAWSDEYVKGFNNSVGTEVSSGFTQLVNQQLVLLEEVYKVKVGSPAGLNNGVLLNRGIEETPYANISLSLISDNLSILKKVFTAEEKIGIDDYLASLAIPSATESLDKKILKQFDLCEATLASVSFQFNQAKKTENVNIEELYNQLAYLYILMKVDMMSQLGLTVTFGDNDGD